MDEKIKNILVELDELNSTEKEMNSNIERRLKKLELFIGNFKDEFRTKSIIITVMTKINDHIFAKDLNNLLILQEQRYPVGENLPIPIDNLISTLPYLREKMIEEYEINNGSFNVKVSRILSTFSSALENKTYENYQNDKPLLKNINTNKRLNYINNNIRTII